VGCCVGVDVSYGFVAIALGACAGIPIFSVSTCYKFHTEDVSGVVER
jgi:hypothetical protein